MNEEKNRDQEVFSKSNLDLIRELSHDPTIFYAALAEAEQDWPKDPAIPVHPLSLEQYKWFKKGVRLNKTKRAEIGAILKEEGKLIKEYVNTCARYKTEKPDLTQLRDTSGVSASSWSRKLKKPHFLLTLLVTLEKKKNLAKEPTREFWIKALGEVEQKLGHLTQGIQRKRKQDRRGVDGLSVEDIES
jgi:hypothetical protein